jgi:hypothetical protein
VNRSASEAKASFRTKLLPTPSRWAWSSDQAGRVFAGAMAEAVMLLLEVDVEVRGVARAFGDEVRGTAIYHLE